MSTRTPNSLILKTLIIILVILSVTSCNSRPSKYRKKKECDCPKWNHRKLPLDNGVHANLDHHKAYITNSQVNKLTAIGS
ncbi:MAG: hypothetical protein WAR83_04440 [Flavobacteriales bacterium]|nr:hypothetical protein [Flavobacteriales bacterium]